MKILAFDTSNGVLSIALLEDQRILELVNIQENGKQAEMLVPLIEEVLHRQKIWHNNLDLIATTKGPGSFTGVRIGLSCARTIKLATNLPLLLVDSLTAIAYKHRAHHGKILAAIDAKMDEFFVAEFFAENGKLTRLTESRLVDSINFAEISSKHNFICGSAKNIEDNVSANLIGLIAYEEFKNGGNFEDVDPAYLRMPRISERKK